jgi:hypothetical protein
MREGEEGFLLTRLVGNLVKRGQTFQSSTYRFKSMLRMVICRQWCDSRV